MSNVWSVPWVTVIARPVFQEPEHLKVDWVSPAMDGERLIEYAGRLCYMSQANPAARTTGEYIENIKKQAHGSVLEHANYSLLFEGVSRSLTHELVRHRAGFAYSQLSQRYVDESDTGFVIPPALLDLGDQAVLKEWTRRRMEDVEEYQHLSDVLFDAYAHIDDRTARRKAAREAARSVLPNCTETKIVVTGNVRAWRNWLELRGAEGAEREIRRLASHVRVELAALAPSAFSDFEEYIGADKRPALRCTYHKV